MNKFTAPVTVHLERLLALKEEAQVRHQRRMVVVAGDLGWCNDLANALIEALRETDNGDYLWIAKESPEPTNRLQQIIGGESPLLLFNAHHGFDPNLFGTAAGTVVGGGLIVLLTPEFEKWRKKSDPVSSRITVYPHPPESITNRYITRLIQIIEAGERESLTTVIHPSQPPKTACKITKPVFAAPQEHDHPEQQQAIEAIIHTATGHRHRPLVITAARGRGKSAALGIAAGQLIRDGKQHIVVTAPSRAAVDSLFKHADSSAETSKNDASLEFIAPDALIRNPIDAGLILVDEAAAIPTPILVQIVKRYPRVVFATTTHGYEGSGQGFALRFLRTLQQITPDFSVIELNQPIRWSEGDPVEELINRMLLLDTEAKLPTEVKSTNSIQIDQINRIDRAQLAQNEPELRHLFGLLVLAHYRTTPLDLRQLLDGPNLSIYTAISKNTIIATALIADEGEIESELAHEIWLGKRRPQGHLLPQTLIAHLGIRDAAPLRYRRIIRIAVHPELQRRGVGRALMKKITADASTDQIDILGTSYGATTELIRFWSQNHMTPIFVGSQRNASSGTYALTQLSALSERGNTICTLAERRFQNGLLNQLHDPLKQLEHEIVQQLLKPVPFNPAPHDLDDFNAFADGHRRYETVITPLIQLLLGHFDKIGALTPMQQQLLILKLLQNHPWSHCGTLLNIDGKAAILTEMRSAISILRNHL
ncbi:MAG: GNAT family N-acetyltransferase [Chromatiales bacterium]|nr:GNAT family N-acetyltransferase [Chromatiales bacterium]